MRLYAVHEELDENSSLYRGDPITFDLTDASDRARTEVRKGRGPMLVVEVATGRRVARFAFPKEP